MRPGCIEPAKPVEKGSVLFKGVWTASLCAPFTRTFGRRFWISFGSRPHSGTRSSRPRKGKKDTLYGVLPPIPHRSVHLPTDKGIQTPELHLIPASIHRKPLH